MKPKQIVRWCVMVNDEMYPDSLSGSEEGAASYLDDAKHAAAKGAKVRLAKVIIQFTGKSTKVDNLK